MKTRHWIIAAALLALPCGVSAQGADRYEVMFANHHQPTAPMGGLEIRADRLDILQCCTATLRLDGEAVATFQTHQVATVVNRSIEGDRVFRVMTTQGEITRIHADRMVPQQNNLIFFFTDGRLSAFASQNSGQMVVDEGVLIEDRARRVDDLRREEPADSSPVPSGPAVDRSGAER